MLRHSGCVEGRIWLLRVGWVVSMSVRWTGSGLTLMLLSAKVSIRLDIARGQRRGLSISKGHRPVGFRLTGDEAAADVLLV